MSYRRKLTRQQIDACRVILNDCDITLGRSWIDMADAPLKAARLQAWADLCHYRKPKKAPRGSRLRYFHDMLQRRAKATTIPYQNTANGQNGAIQASTRVHRNRPPNAGDVRYTAKGRGEEGSTLRKLHDAREAARLRWYASATTEKVAP